MLKSISRLFAILFFFFVLILGISFSSLNSHVVDVNYYVGTSSLPLSFVVISAFALGVVCAFVVGVTTLWGLRWRVSRLRRDVSHRDQEIQTLKKQTV
jgi:uncharacterized integral membrane protein